MRKNLLDNDFEDLNEEIEAYEQKPKQELTREEKRELRRLRKQRAKDNRLFKKYKRSWKKNNGQPLMIGVASTIVLMVAVLFIYSLAYLSAPSHTITANVTVVRGGYGLEYPMCSIASGLLPSGTKEGDIVNVNVYGQVEPLSRDTIQMRVESIDYGTATLSFVAKGLPDFISTEEMKGLLKFDKNASMQYNQIYITGRIVAGRFSILKISLTRS